MNDTEPKKVFVRVETWDSATSERKHVRVINFLNRDSRQWLTKHMQWALNNGQDLDIRPFETYDAAVQHE